METVKDLESITADDIRLYLQYLNCYEKDRKDGKGKETITNSNNGKSRKLATLKSLYNYFYNNDKIEKNPAAKVDMPKIKDKPIIYLDENEIVKLADLTQSKDNSTSKRNKAMVYLFLGTGMRVSELVGINLTDIDFEKNEVNVTRKGEKGQKLYFNDDVKEALQDYLQEREEQGIQDEAFFISNFGKRITVQQVENIVKKYTSEIVGTDKITPHKLRSTYGTNLYKETSDIYLVATVLGHSNVNTTKKHYAAMPDEKKRMAAQAIKFRKEE
jgi:site-specific recombinase XerD